MAAAACVVAVAGGAAAGAVAGATAGCAAATRAQVKTRAVTAINGRTIGATPACARTRLYGERSDASASPRRPTARGEEAQILSETRGVVYGSLATDTLCGFLL